MTRRSSSSGTGDDLIQADETKSEFPDPRPEEQEAARAYAAGYHQAGSDAHFYERRLELVLDLIDHCPGGILLDAGCGPGMLIERVLQARDGSFRIVGLDISAGMLAECRARVGHCRDVALTQGRIEDLPFPDESFDVALAMGVLEYTIVQRSLSELARITRRGGTVVVSMLNARSPYRLWERQVYDRLYRLRGRRGGWGWSDVERLYGVRELRSLMGQSGLRPDRVLGYDVNLCLAPLDRRHPMLAFRAAERLEFLASGPLRWLATGFLVRARSTRRLRSRQSVHIYP
jgi:ubiquinone/menaquinone biosynthesis C-methylase UbiE